MEGRRVCLTIFSRDCAYPNVGKFKCGVPGKRCLAFIVRPAADFAASANTLKLFTVLRNPLAAELAFVSGVLAK
jgi:hypothetical protein